MLKVKLTEVDTVSDEEVLVVEDDVWLTEADSLKGCVALIVKLCELV